MTRMALTLLIILAAGCAGPSGRDSDAQRRLDAQRELDRDCRMAARMNTYDPRCPQPDPYMRQPPPQRQSPQLPPVNLPKD